MDAEDPIRELLARGDVDGAASRAVDALGGGVLGYLRTLHDPDDAEDVFQQWAEDLWRGLPGFRGDAALRSWAYRLAWHASCRFRRDRWQKRRTRLATSAASKLAQSMVRSTPLGPGPDERLELLRRDLDPEDRTLLLLRLDREMSWDEIAAVLSEEGTPATSAMLRKRFQRLKERLGQLAREKGILA